MARPKLPVRHARAASPSTRRFIVVPWKKLRWVNSPRAPLMGSSLHSRCLYNSLERYRSIYIAMNHAVNWATQNNKNHKPASSERKKALHTPHTHTHTQAHKRRECSLKDYNMTKTHTPNENCLSCAYSGFKAGATFRCVFWTLYKFRAKVLPHEPTKKHILRGLGNGMLAARLLFTTYWGHNAREHTRRTRDFKKMNLLSTLRWQKKKKKKVMTNRTSESSVLSLTKRYVKEKKNVCFSEKQRCAITTHCKPPYCCSCSLKRFNRLHSCSPIKATQGKFYKWHDDFTRNGCRIALFKMFFGYFFFFTMTSWWPGKKQQNKLPCNWELTILSITPQKRRAWFWQQ